MWIISQDFCKFYDGYKKIIAYQQLLETEFEVKLRYRIEKLREYEEASTIDWEIKNKAYSHILNTIYSGLTNPEKTAQLIRRILWAILMMMIIVATPMGWPVILSWGQLLKFLLTVTYSTAESYTEFGKIFYGIIMCSFILIILEMVSILVIKILMKILQNKHDPLEMIKILPDYPVKPAIRFLVNIADTPPDIMTTWLMYLETNLYSHYKPQIGDVGENKLIQRVQQLLPNSYFSIQGQLVTSKIKNDADLFIVGPTGLWLFESKYYSGTVSLKHGKWLHNEKDCKKIDEQWALVKRSILIELNKKLDKSFYSKIEKNFHGGLVFTNDLVNLDIDNTTQAEYGKIDYWEKILHKNNQDEILSFDEIFQIIDIYLEIPAAVSGTKKVEAAKFSDDIYELEKNKLVAICNEIDHFLSTPAAKFS